MKIQLHGIDGDVWAYNSYKHGKKRDAGFTDPTLYTCVIRAHYSDSIWDKQQVCQYAVFLPAGSLAKFNKEFTTTWGSLYMTGDWYGIPAQYIIDTVVWPCDAGLFIFEYEVDATIFKLRWL